MRRKDRVVTDENEIIEIIKKCDTCRLAFFDEGYPYIVPMNFGFICEDDKLIFYFHSANEGKKLDALKKNNNVGFEMDCSHKLLEAEVACGYTMEFESIMGNGVMEIVDSENKIEALKILMKQYSNATEFKFEEKYVNAITMLKLTVKNITAKRLKKCMK